ncbi:hypothetical protein N2603_28825 [Bradyrhizobium huanghuaihaiense]|uniref:hypothetical protein n=1 Tax=Bradyrhizobium huanghuaihaiense TaxID=990078 RepID=UPI0021AA8AB2|nr:hypothetical protein [Bradyrhizobium sp. CB3035]UWU74053.1 hypothetical protein N2603_28825 [Bradyrhizobium sp. CB3035]
MNARFLLKNTFSSQRRIFPVLGYREKIIDALKPLRTDRCGVASFEYVILAACVVVVGIAVFGPGNDVSAALTGTLTAISAAIATAAGV